MTTAPSGEQQSTDADVEATLVASRALLGVVARSIAEALDVVTLPQFRVLVVLRTAGPLRMGALAERMNINPSTFSRFVDRMVEGGWIQRKSRLESRREVLIDLTAHGAQLVDHVTHRRQRELATILSELDPAQRRAVRRGFEVFALAAGEPSATDLLILGI
ncbi:MarR family transcriptional regulator [Lysinimonas soli]|uniref:MarR family transcriptional regulator n=1 Tax=Lysinimonas soli TaxID=1074233 RepID=A0ABW0NW29_9MICO